LSRRQRRRLLISSGIVLGVALLLSGLFTGGLFAAYQRQLSDIMFRTKAAMPDVSRFVVIVAVDDKSVTELKQHGRFFYWPRSLHAEVVRRLVEARARTIVFDVLFDAEGEGDEELVAALNQARERATFVVMPRFGEALAKSQGARTGRQAYVEAVDPLPKFTDLATGLGMTNQIPDPDGTIRRMPLLFDIAGQPVPSLSLMGAAKFLRRPEAWDGPIDGGAIPLAGRSIPIDESGGMVVNYVGGPHETATPAFPVVSFVDVLNGRTPPETFERKLVLVGLTATGYADDYWTPPSIGGKMDGVEIHANAIDTILRGEFVEEAPSWLTVVLIFVFAILAGVSLLTLSPLVASLISMLTLGAYIVATSASFDSRGVILNLIYPPLSLYVTFGVIMLHRVIFEQGETRALRGVLGQYLSPSVVAEVTRDPDSLKLGGDEREMTVLFTDLKDFTTISESLDAEHLVQWMTEYLTAMSDVIFRFGGTIDKYMGDAVMAFWGAPQRQDDHATLACRAALAMLAELDRLNEHWEQTGRPRMHMRIGINSGRMKVGNMGSASRFDYTVLGDAVNLGARLEALNKQYGTTLIVSEATLRAAGEGFHARFLDLVAVKGKTEPVVVYEVMTGDGEYGERTTEALRAYEEGIRLYQERDWLLAAARFQEALRLAPEDGASALYLERSESLIREPPPADWNGVFVMTHK
jgi:adenylate cyclase